MYLIVAITEIFEACYIKARRSGESQPVVLSLSLSVDQIIYLLMFSIIVTSHFD